MKPRCLPPNALRYTLPLILAGATRVLAQSSASCVHHQGDDQHGDDDDDNGEDDDPSDHSSSWTNCNSMTRTMSGNGNGNASATGSPAITGTSGGASSSASSAASRGGSADISNNGSSFNKGSIAGIVIALLVFLIIAAYLARFFRRRYAKRKRLENKTALLGPSVLSSSNPAGTKEMHQTMQNVTPAHPPGLRRNSTLPSIPFDTPAYTSTDNLTSQRGSTLLSYNSPSVSSGAASSGVATAGHGHSRGESLHEGMLSRQKELESGYRRMEMGQLDEYSPSVSGASGSGYAAVPGHLPEHPPPQYGE